MLPFFFSPSNKGMNQNWPCHNTYKFCYRDHGTKQTLTLIIIIIIHNRLYNLLTRLSGSHIPTSWSWFVFYIVGPSKSWGQKSHFWFSFHNSIFVYFFVSQFTQLYSISFAAVGFVRMMNLENFEVILLLNFYLWILLTYYITFAHEMMKSVWFLEGKIKVKYVQFFNHLPWWVGWLLELLACEIGGPPHFRNLWNDHFILPYISD